jgi:hypothetical protein
MAGRPPKPTNLLELTGAFRKNPARRKARENEPQAPHIPLAPPASYMRFHPELGYQKAEKLRAIWENCLTMWPWVTFSDRDAIEDYCDLKYKKGEGIKLSGTELSAMIKIRTDLGGTGVGRAKLGVSLAGVPGRKEKEKAADPRAAFLSRKTG